MRRFTILLGILLSILVIIPINAMADDNPNFSVLGPTNVTRGNTFTITISGSNIKNLYGFETVLNFDSDKLDIVSYKSGLSNSFELNKTGDNKITYASTKLGNADMVNGNLDLVTFTFKAKSSGTAKISLNTVKIADKDAKSNIYTVNKDLNIGIAESGSGSAVRSGGTGNSSGMDSGQKPTAPQTSDLGNVSIQNGKATLTVDVNKINDAINSDANTINIDLSTINNASEKSVSIPVDSIKNAIAKGKDLIIKTEDANIKLDANALNLSSVSGNLEISIKNAGKESSLNGMSPVSNTLDINVKSGNTDVSVNKGVTITIKANSINDYRKVGIYYYNESAGKWEYIGGKADKVNGTVTFNAAHFSKYAAFEYNKVFKDVSNSHWANDVIGVIAAKHIIEGIDNENYAPDRNITRAQFASMMVRMLGINEVTYKGGFADVKGDAWYANAIQAAYDKGIIEGDGKNMNPDKNITREEMAAIIMRVYEKMSGYKEENLSKTSFNDDNIISDWAKIVVANASKTGLMTGESGNLFAPKSNATRAEAAAVLYRILEKTNNM